jgi:geranylgeranylglycerol-phosphate geranylgeranyltransferase
MKPPPAASIQTLIALFIITRPVNVAITGLSILTAAILAMPAGELFHFTTPVIGAMISGMLITAGANVINDLCDLDIDRINRPQRVLPSGRLTLPAAQTFTIFLFACGNFFSIFINKIAAMIAAGTSLLLLVYSWKLKRQPVFGNLAVSLATALAFIYGATAAQVGFSQLSTAAAGEIRHEIAGINSWTGGWRAGIFPAVFSFLFHFGREVIKDIEDRIGDQARQARTLPLAYGLNAAQMAATIAFVLLLAATFVPVHFKIYGLAYLWIILLGVHPVLIWTIYRLWKNPAPRPMRQISAALKADMLVGLAAIYFGK